MSDGPDAADLAIEQAPEYVASRNALEERVAAGDYGSPVDEFFDELQRAALDEGIAELDAGQDTDGPEFLKRFRVSSQGTKG